MSRAPAPKRTGRGATFRAALCGVDGSDCPRRARSGYESFQVALVAPGEVCHVGSDAVLETLAYEGHRARERLCCGRFAEANSWFESGRMRGLASLDIPEECRDSNRAAPNGKESSYF